MVRHRKSRKTSRKKMEVIKLRKRKGAKENENIKFKKGGLHESLKFSGTFTKAEMARLDKKKIGQKFTFKGNKFVMTDKLKDQVTLAKTMMSWNKTGSRKPSRKKSRKPKKTSRKPSRKTSRKPSRKKSRKPKKTSRKPSRKKSRKPSRKKSRKPSRKTSRKPSRKKSRKPSRKSSRKPKKAGRKPSRKTSRKPSRKKSRKPSRKKSSKPKKVNRKPSHKTSSKLKKTVPAANKKVKAGTYLREILDILRSENRWFIYDSYQNSYPNQKWEKEKAYSVLDIGPSCYVVGALKRGIKLGLIEKRERPGEKRLYMGHVYKAVWDDAPVKKKSPNKKQPKKTKKYKIGDVKSELKSVFFVLGAPNEEIIKQLNDFYAQNKGNMKIVFCSDYYTMVDTERAKDKYPSGKKKKIQPPIADDIHGIPTNCRAHAEPGKDEEILTDEKIKKFRNEQITTSKALVYMFNFSINKNVPLYLASIPRDIRPLNVSLNEKSNPLTQQILKSIVYPSYANKETFDKQLEEHSKYNASFLIDLITVVMAMLPDIVWSKKKVKVSTKTGIYKSHKFRGKPVTLWKNQIENVTYFKIEEHVGEDAITVYTFDFNDENMQRLNGKLNQVATDISTGDIQPCFKNSFVFGDDLLNDVDDIPARYVVRFYTQNNVENYINYDCGDICSSFL